MDWGVLFASAVLSHYWATPVVIAFLAVSQWQISHLTTLQAEEWHHTNINSIPPKHPITQGKVLCQSSGYSLLDEESHLQAGGGISVSCNALLQRANLLLQRRALLTQSKHLCSELRRRLFSCLFCLLQTNCLMIACSSSRLASCFFMQVWLYIQRLS